MSLKTRSIRLLWHGELNLHTGFGGVSANILDRLYNLKTEWGTPKYEICVMALGIGVDPLNGPPKNKPYKIVPMYGNSQAAPFGQDYARDLVSKFRPDIVVSFGDTWMQEWWNNRDIIPEDLRKTFKLVFYTAIDGYPIPRFWVDKYKQADKVIAFTKFGKDTIDERAKEMNVKLNTSLICHGVNPQVFKPLPQSQVEEFKKSRGLEGKKVIGMFARNQPRKHHPEFVEFAAHLLEKTNNDPNIMFYFHTIQQDAGWQLPELIEDYDKMVLRKRFERDGFIGPGQIIPEKNYTLGNRFIFPGIANPAQGYPLDMLNMMYNICDLTVLLTSGEGWGLPLIESLSAGIPTFTNFYAAGTEIIKDSGGGEVINSRDYTYRGSDHNFIRPHTDYQDAVDKVLKVLNDSELKKKYSKNARSYAFSMSWDSIIYDWERELDAVMTINSDVSPRVEKL